MKYIDTNITSNIEYDCQEPDVTESNIVLPKRQGWDRPLEFLFAIIGYSVGMGNIWRFPYICYESGGGAFILAYLIMWTLCGVPLLYMELAIGQYTQFGPLSAMEKLCPLFKAAGSVVKATINRTLYIFGHFITSSIASNKSFRGADVDMIGTHNPAGHVLQITSGIDNFGIVRWELALILLLIWILIYLSVFRGTKSVGKVVYLTVLFPYIVLILLIIRGITLPGSYEGLLFLIAPKWYRLTEPKAVWVFSSIKYSPFSFGSYIYPTWAVAMAWIIASLPLICIPIGMAHALYRTPSISLVKEWDRPVEFLFAIVGYSVGIGNVWRFPYTCYESGGGAFLVAYLIMWTLCGVPLLFMELAIGQYARLGPIGAMAHICPLFKGAAAGCIVMTGINLTYYMVILVWSFYFLFNSFKQELPWSRCGNEWNTQYCFVPTNLSYEIEIENKRNKSTLNIRYGKQNNISFCRILQISCPEIISVVQFVPIYMNTKHHSVVYFTVLFPYFVLIVLIIRGLTLPGSYEGIMFLFTPKWHTLAQPQPINAISFFSQNYMSLKSEITWIHAAATNFFSLGIGGGAAITLASFNKRKGKILGYTLIIAFVDLMTSLMAGVAVFSNLGYLAQIHGKQIKEIVDSGTEGSVRL
ncbi:hypothetical protein KUTeg_011885 [Tegillarca granosa]|uniref:Transporter n=1 Tax=Tegillarca granosa TaxID=220873 RepID=A0ABQ9F356_TEGGR|nr:hypothetical protein KUTeg_011885 [Tegillarca granosa]